MTTLENLVQTPLAKALGWTIFHSLWEGAIVAAGLFVALYLFRSSRLRYTAACVAMLAILAAFVATLFLLLPEKPEGAITAIRNLPRAAPAGYDWLPEMSSRLRMADVLPWLTPFWIAGVLLFQLRGLISWTAARRLRGRGVCIAPAIWQQTLSKLRDAMLVSGPVALLESSLAEVPVVIGYLRPAILVPVSMLTAMPATQIEAILLHELAHIRRRDYLMNLMQTMVESLLFYHPAIWWISNVIRTERENCCDDLVVAASGDAHEYAVALTALEQHRWAAQDRTAVLAATGGNLMKRISRLLNPLMPRESPRAVLTPFLSAAILTLTVTLALTAWQTQTQTQTPAPNTQQMAPWQRWVYEDVAYIITDNERAAFLALRNDEEREAFVEQFWQRRDPTPGTVENEFKNEHYRRIAYSSRFTADSGLPGWKTDRGRTYIVYGPPDEIDWHSTGGGKPQASAPWGTWKYRHIDGVGNNILIEFVDTAMNGEFHMTMDPNPSGGIRVR
ncbi:MAG TPA: GWxTD domain-containing protein [Bryobacteraceae bacterium]|jgi:GWxTD domain-containing protein|nr:GWxTD domain-containing protein [Bryobacteraceae bacterium]